MPGKLRSESHYLWTWLFYVPLRGRLFRALSFAPLHFAKARESRSAKRRGFSIRFRASAQLGA
jgi:hypothetical protein